LLNYNHKTHVLGDWRLTDLNVTAHVFCDNNSVIISIFAVLMTQ